MLISGLDSKHFASLMDISAKEATIANKLTLFFNRVFFLFFKTHQWENNHTLTNRLTQEWNHLGDPEKALKYQTIKSLAKNILAGENSTDDLKILNELKQSLKTFKLAHPEMIHQPSLPRANRENLDAFLKQVKAGIELLKSDVPNVGLDIYSFLIFTLDQPHGLAVTVDMGDARYGYMLDDINDCNQLILPMLSANNNLNDFKETAAHWAKRALQFNKERVKEGRSPYTKFFFPIAVPGVVQHGVLGVVELGSEKDPKVKITIIDPLGENSGYRALSSAFAEGLQSAFSLKNTLATKLVFSKVKQQLDGRSCGYHQFLNIRDLLNQDDIQNFVEEKKLTIRSRKEIETFVEELRPRFPEFEEGL